MGRVKILVGDCREVLAGMRATLQTLLEEGPPRPLAMRWRDDGQPSKLDQCPHGVMYEDCGGCVDAFVTAALAEKGDARDADPSDCRSVGAVAKGRTNGSPCRPRRLY